MYKKFVLLFVMIIGLVSCGYDCAAATNHYDWQPSVKETKHLEHSLDIFTRKVISKNKVTNLQYKRFGKQAVLSFDVVKPNEVMLMLYMLEYSGGEWRIAKEYHYTKTILPATASVC